MAPLGGRHEIEEEKEASFHADSKNVADLMSAFLTDRLVAVQQQLLLKGFRHCGEGHSCKLPPIVHTHIGSCWRVLCVNS